MNLSFRNVHRNLFRSFIFTPTSTLNPNLNTNSPIFLSPPHTPPAISISLYFPSTLNVRGLRCLTATSYFSSSSSPPPVGDRETHAPPDYAMEEQFEKFRSHLEESGNLRERIRNVAVEIELVTRVMYANLLLVHQSRRLSEVLEKVKAQISVLREHYKRLAEILQECPGQYYRYHNDWRSETQTVVSLLAFMHWLEKGCLLMHAEAEELLGLNDGDFGLDTEDYLVGICFMSNELPRYVVNQVTAGDYDCPRKVLSFLTDLHAAFRMLNLRNDFLRKKFDGMKYDLRKVEEVHYDVKIRGLAASGETKAGQEVQEQA